MSDRPHGDTDWERVAAYVAGECTPAEAVEIERWIAADPDRQALVDRLREAWVRARTRAADEMVIDTDAEWRRMEARLRSHADERSSRPRRGTEIGRRPPLSLSRENILATTPTTGQHVLPMQHQNARSNGVRRPLWRSGVAAAALLVAAAGVTAVWQRGHQEEHSVVARMQQSMQPMREYVTARGQRAQLELADGTRIALAPASRLRVPIDMTTGSRNTILDGEAFFAVAHDASRPFTVSTTQGVAQDIGTAFVVTDYRETHGMQVVVAEGSIALQRAGSTSPTHAIAPGAPRTAAANGTSASAPGSIDQPLVTLMRGDMARLDTTGTVTLKRGIDVTPYLSWTRDTLTFVATPLRDAAPAISRWYDLDVRLADSTIGERHLEASFGDMPASVALKLIALSLDLRIEQHGRMVTLYPLHQNGNQRINSDSTNNHRAADAHSRAERSF